MNRPTGSDASAPEGDPWAAFGYLVAGVAFYGALGWGLSVWLHADYLIPIGIVVGIGFGMYMVFSRYRFRDPGAQGASSEPVEPDRNQSTSVDTGDAAQRPASDDRGDTA